MKKYLKIILMIIIPISIIMGSGLLDNHFNLRVFTMFTVLSNILCFVSLIIDKNHFIKGMSLSAISITFIIAQFILKMGFDFKSFSSAAFLGLHYLVPILYFLYFLLDKHECFKKSYPLLWLGYPIIYLLFCLIFKYYPYPFIDLNLLGLKAVMINVIKVACGMLVLNYFYYFLDYYLGKKS